MGILLTIDEVLFRGWFVLNEDFTEYLISWGLPSFKDVEPAASNATDDPFANALIL